MRLQLVRKSGAGCDRHACRQWTGLGISGYCIDFPSSVGHQHPGEPTLAPCLVDELESELLRWYARWWEFEVRVCQPHRRALGIAGSRRLAPAARQWGERTFGAIEFIATQDAIQSW